MASSPSSSSSSAACNSFSMSLFKQLVETNNNNDSSSGNVFYSPLSICSALAMVLLGARGDTAAQMSQVLHFSGHDDHMDLSKLMKDLNNNTPAAGEEEPHLHTLSLAVRLYGEQSYRFAEEFLSDAGKLYDTRPEPVDFVNDAEGARLSVNGWVEKQTHGKIKELLASGAVDHLTRLVLVNGFYFKGKWDRPFSEARTGDAQFRLGKAESKTVEMMYQTATFPLGFVPEVDCQVLELPYAGGDLSMLVFLPVETEDDDTTTTGLDRLEEELTYERFVEWTKPGTAMHRREVEVGLPRFRMEETYNMKDVLIGMGMADAFDDERSDFSGMSPDNDLVLSKVVHRACVEVSEEGSEAAASTAAILSVRSGPQSFVADHPFLFFIRHRPTMSILFAGRYCSPP